MIENKKRLVVFDGNALIHRGFHALPALTSPKGELVNAIYGFLLVFLKALKDLQPDYIVATFDMPGPTFRNKLYREYKAKRAKAPDELYKQIPETKRILNAFKVAIFEKQGFEADDIIGTIAKLAKRKQIAPLIETIIITGDLDALRLVDANTKVYTLRKGLKDTVIYDKDLVMERYNGLRPEQLTDFRALRGDPSDNIPGVSGIGEKTAIQLLKEYETLESLYLALENNNTPLVSARIQEKLKQDKEQAFFSKTLAEIDTSVSIDFSLENCQSKEFNKEKIIKIFQEFGFYSLIKRLPKGEQVRLGNF